MRKLNRIKKDEFAKLIINWKHELFSIFAVRRWSDEEYIKIKYKSAFGVEPNLKWPQTFNEKLQWLKLNQVTDEMRICADKFSVREYLQGKGYGNLLNPLIGVYQKPEAIKWKEMPEKFVIKASHGSGWNIVCTNLSEIGRLRKLIWILLMKSWLRQNLYVYGREPVYKEIIPRIVCEEYIESATGLLDYKFFCFNGKTEFVQVTINEEPIHKINLYSTEWKRLAVNYAYPPSAQEIPCPIHFDMMKKIAEDLASPFDFVRIDLYSVERGVIFGEMTFFPSSGFRHFTPEVFDLELGQKLKLSNFYSN